MLFYFTLYKFNNFVCMLILVLDVIGVVDNVRCNPQSKNVVFHIRDLSSAVIGCTLWDSYYFKFMSNWRGEADSFVVVVMLTQAKIKPSSGRWPVSISNSWNGSKLFMGDECSELVRFKEQWIQRFGNEVSQSQEASELSSPSQYTEHEKFMYKAVVSTISEITTMKEEVYCVTVATTVKFNLGNDGWCYPVCNGCRKKTEEIGAFKCVMCGFNNGKPGIRYKLELQVCDGDSYANFVMWDQDCTNLIGVSAVELMNKMIEDGEDDPKCFPEDLDVMLGCTLAFKNNKESSGEAMSDSSTEENSKARDQIQMGKQSSHVPVCDSNNQNESFPIIAYESQTDVINKESSPTDTCGSKMKSMAVGLIKSGSRGKNIKESSPTAIYGSSTQSKATNLIRTGFHGNKVKESDPVDLSPCSTQSKTLASTKTPSHTGKIKEPRCNKNTEADNAMLTVSGSEDHDPYIDFCVTPTKDLLLDFEVDCDHLEDIPSVEFSRSKTKKRMKQEKH
ncbi:uncharacterized protein LOC114165898 isoform X3 [Vigna unguiculata]|uniref:uncharacterized protein LOC114165898 isoform X3 n=1 Tax=Vigna unguiculata TaxID=3917 RepID=UPI001016CF4F|nr:uncharacterized protein LOC114165898 isoform X3 [Vigna unguiculata]